MSTNVMALVKTMPVKVGILMTSPAEILDPANEGAAAEGGALHPLMKLMDSYGAGFMTLGNRGFVYVLFFCGLGAFIGLMVHRNNPTRIAEQKSAVIPLLVGAVGGFGLLGLITLLSTIGQSLFQ